jgi:hypothetical protein
VIPRPEREKIMSAFRRRILAAFAVAGAVFAAVAPVAAAHAVSAVPHVVICPKGTHWDDGKHACV